MATVKLMIREAYRSHFDHAKTERELGGRFRPVEETIADVVAWYADNGYIRGGSRAQARWGEVKG